MTALPLRIHWRLPWNGDQPASGTSEHSAARSLPQIAAQASFCRLAEDAGIDSVLTPCSFYMPDPVVTIAALGPHTRRLRFILAARSGTVVRVVQHHTARGNRKPNNLVTIDHGDGTMGSYLHIRKGGSRVKVGQSVQQGEVIAESGNVGRSLAPHLHFHVRRGKDTIPISFRDVGRHRGVPRLGYRYRAD